MKYLLIIGHDDAFAPSRTLVRDIGRWIAEAEAEGLRIHGNPLRPAGEGTTVRVRGGRLKRSAGPFSRAKEQICAYELVECPDQESAVALAARHPMAKVASIEVRPVWSELAG